MSGIFRFFFWCVCLAFWLVRPAFCWDGAVCHDAVAVAEQQAGIPSGLLNAISRIESGRRDPLSGKMAAWPWTVNAAGKGYFYESRQEAIAAVEAFQKAGVTQIDVGCMQVNLRFHPDAFSSLEEAFDPAVNARYGASFLRGLFERLGDWSAATAGYHSLTPALGEEYERHVMAVWHGQPDDYRPPDFLPQVVVIGGRLQAVFLQGRPSVPAHSAPHVATVVGSVVRPVSYMPPPRVIRHPEMSSGGGQWRGRDLMSYRVNPVRVAGR